MAKPLPFDKNRKIRIFAGPNGSGKTTILESIKGEFNIGKYINADDIELSLRNDGYIALSKFGLTEIPPAYLNEKILKHPFSQKAIAEGYEVDIFVDGELVLNPGKRTHSYEAALLADIFRNELVNRGKRLTFETVMSHPSKVSFLEMTKDLGYRNYLYFICTDNPKINIARVRQRVILGGHHVDEQKIKDRYYKSLELLHQAIKNTYRTYILDNSGEEKRLILEIFQGKQVQFLHPKVPSWVDKYVLGGSV